MKFCQKCGKELFDDAVVCVGCGCPVGVNNTTSTKRVLDPEETERRKAKIKKTIIIACIVLGVIVAMVFAAIPVVNTIKADAIAEEIAGEEFVYSTDTSYSLTRYTYTFDEDGNCEDYTYYYGITMDDPMEFTFNWTYEVKIKGGEAYVILSNDDELKVKYDEEGEIVALYNTEDRNTYERQ